MKVTGSAKCKINDKLTVTVGGQVKNNNVVEIFNFFFL